MMAVTYTKKEIIECMIGYCEDMDARDIALVKKALSKIPAADLRGCYVEVQRKHRTCRGMRSYTALKFLPIIALSCYPQYFSEDLSRKIRGVSE